VLRTARQASEQPRLLSIDEAADRLGVTPRWLREQVRDKRVPHVRLGSRISFTSDHLEAIIKAREVALAVEADPLAKVRARFRASAVRPIAGGRR
jgi:excisionase family DNA binding protein